MLRSSRHYLRAQSQWHHTTDLISWRREAWKEEALDDLPWKDKRGTIINQTNTGTASKAMWGKLLWNGVKRILAFSNVNYHLELNWTQMNLKSSYWLTSHPETRHTITPIAPLKIQAKNVLSVEWVNWWWGWQNRRDIGKLSIFLDLKKTIFCRKCLCFLVFLCFVV